MGKVNALVDISWGFPILPFLSKMLSDKLQNLKGLLLQTAQLFTARKVAVLWCAAGGGREHPQLLGDIKR